MSNFFVPHRLLLVMSWVIQINLLSAQTIVIQPYLQDAEPNSMSIMWEADGEGKGFLDWGTNPFDLGNIIFSQTEIGLGASLIHIAHITGLTSGTKYYYRSRTNTGQTSFVYHFRTPSDQSANESVQLMAMSDMQRDNNNPDKYREMIEEGLIPIIQSEVDSVFSELDAILIPGDLVVTGGNYSQWQNHFFNPSDSLTPFVPLYPVPGNHEYHNGGLPNFIKYFDLPKNGVAGLEEECWYKDLSNIRIIGLNSNSGAVDQDLQLAWLQTVLDSTFGDDDIDFIFAELHHPYKSELWTPGESNFTGEVIEKLEAFTDSCGKASVHFFGHTHGYSRGQSRDHEHLWMNVATAGGKIDYWGEYPNADYEEFTYSEDEYGFVLVEATAGDDPSLKLRRYTRGDESTTKENEVSDQIEIRKNEFAPGQPFAVYPDMDSIEAQCLILKASAFQDPGDAHQATHWQIATDCDFENSLVTERWKQSQNWYNEIDFQAEDDLTDESFSDLEPDQSYCWRVRYRDQYLKWSEWSETKTFYLQSSGSDLTGNLLLNNGAENGITSWTGDIESLLSNECNSVPAYQGASLFGVGGICANEITTGYANQVIDLSTYSSQISLGNVSIYYAGYMRDFSGSDIPEMYVEFYDDQATLIGTTPPISNATPTWILKSNLALIPANAIEARVTLKGTRNAGSDNDSYFDDLFAKLTIAADCNDCLSGANSLGIDIDGDGFCAELDCNDQDSTIYPGALELCDQKDNNCNGYTDAGAIVTWTGAGDGILWHDDQNWDQGFVPLPCQHIVINNGDSVVISENPYIKSLFLGTLDILKIDPLAILTIDGNNSNSFDSARIDGKVINEGKCFLRQSQNNALQVSGTFINDGQIFINQIATESLTVKPGGIFINRSLLQTDN